MTQADAAAGLARMVKRADLEDRSANRSTRAGGWSPPYERGLEILERSARRDE